MWSGWPSLFSSHPPRQHTGTSAGGEGQSNTSQNVIIDIESGDIPARDTSIASDSVGETSHSEQFTNTLDAENTSDPGARIAREPPDHHSSSPLAIEPLLPAGTSSVAAAVSENGNTSDANNEEDNTRNR